MNTPEVASQQYLTNLSSKVPQRDQYVFKVIQAYINSKLII